MRRIDAIHSLAGTLIIIGTAGALWSSKWWLLLTGFVGLNLFQFGITRFCPAECIMKKLNLFQDN